MVFTVAVGAFVFVNQGVFSSLQAQAARAQAINQASQEKLVLRVAISGSTGNMWLRISNVGTVPVSLLDVFVTSVQKDKLVSNSTLVAGSHYLSKSGDLNYSLPLTILPGISTNQMSGCGTKVGCDISISQPAFQYKGSQAVISVLSSSGNIFSSQYPPPPTSSVTTITSTIATASTTTLPGSNPGGNVLVVQMTASPPQTFSCPHCVNDTVVVLNYGNNPVTGVALSPSVPIVQSAGNVIIASTGPCALQGGSNNLPAYSGSGAPPSITWICTFSANPNGFGGFVSFTGAATGTYNAQPVTSGEAISNTIQVGGPVSVLNQGPFSANFFYFKYSACSTKPTSSTPCTTVPSPVAVATLPAANSITGSSSYYVAFYIIITNKFNVTLPILPYTYFQTDPTQGGESPFYIVGNPASLPYLPNYNPGGNNNPTLTPYPATCFATSTASCINLAPGASVTLTFAACDIGLSLWNWAGSAYGTSNGGGACTTNPPNYQPNESTYLSVIITFVYNGQVYTQQIPYVGQFVK